MNIGSTLDRFIAPMAPGWALRRSRSRLAIRAMRQKMRNLSTYEAASQDRLNRDWNAKNKSADQAIIPDLGTIIARGRASVRDSWDADSIVQGYRRHVVGTGITVRSAARNPETDELLEDYNGKLDRLWNRWAEDGRLCDMEGRKSLVGLQSLAIEEFAQAGQALAILVMADGDRAARSIAARVPRLRVQMIEVEQLDTSKTKNARNGNNIRGGVEIDAYGEPVAYWFYTKVHPLETFRRDSKRVEAEQVVDLFRQRRCRQSRGVTPMVSVLKKIRHAGMYDDYTLKQAELQACIGGAIETEPGAVTGFPTGVGLAPDSDGTTQDAYGNEELVIEPAMILDLPMGKTWKNIEPKSPVGQYEAFSKAQTVRIAAGAGLDFPTVSRDFSGNSYSGQRQGMLERNQETDPLQQLLIDAWLRRIREAFITACVMEGYIAAPGFATMPVWRLAYMESAYQAQAKPWIDPLKQAKAAGAEMDIGIATRRDILNEKGMGFAETEAQRADEQRIGGEKGQEVTVALIESAIEKAQAFNEKHPDDQITWQMVLNGAGPIAAEGEVKPANEAGPFPRLSGNADNADKEKKKID